jgi:hypothetical protein
MAKTKGVSLAVNFRQRPIHEDAFHVVSAPCLFVTNETRRAFLRCRNVCDLGLPNYGIRLHGATGGACLAALLVENAHVASVRVLAARDARKREIDGENGAERWIHRERSCTRHRTSAVFNSKRTPYLRRRTAAFFEWELTQHGCLSVC